MRNITKHIIIALALALLTVRPVWAQSILRDAETEAFLREISDPIFVAAGLSPDNVHMYLLHANSINAFVTGGQNIFIHSGLIMAADNANQLTGVIAHETGHISGGHLARVGEAAGVMGATSILSMVLGAAAMVAGSADAGIGIMMAGQSVAQRQFLAYSRVQESAADQAGANFLADIGVSGEGMIQFFGKLRNQEILAQVRQDPYVRSHPLNRDRMQALEVAVTHSPAYKKPTDPALEEKFQRLKAKIVGYLNEPKQTLRKYPLSDTSASARYARVYAYHKALEWDLALAETDALLKLEPENPYFYEIKGQILFENGKVHEALPIFRQAMEFAPHEPLIATAYGQAMVSLEDKDMMAKAVPILERAVREDKNNSFAWFNLAKAYSWLGREADASLATAERFYVSGRAMQAVYHARQALEGFKEGTPEWLRAQDILYVSEDAADRQRREMEKQKRRFHISGNTSSVYSQ